MRRTSCATSRVFTGLALASALCLPAAAVAAQLDYFIKLPPIEGDSGKGRSHGGEIEIQSFSWGETQSAVQIQEISGWKYEVDVVDMPGPASKDMSLKGSTIRENAPAGGVQVAAGDVTGDGSAGVAQYNPKELSIRKSAPRDAASGLATGKRMHKPRMVPAPLASGSVTVRGKFPSCTVGTRYPSLELGARAKRYKLHNVVVTSCGGSDSGEQPMEEISFNYAKVEF